MVVSSNETILYEYPLKVIEIDNFLYNSDDLLWRSVSKTNKGILKIKKKVKREEQNLANIDLSDFNDDDFFTNSSKIPKNLTDTSQITIVFTESEFYKQHFEKTHLKLINNMIIMDNQINFFNEQEAKNFYELLLVSKRWLFHASLKPNGTSFRRDKKLKSILTNFSFNSNQDKSFKSAPQTMDLLLILNTTHSFVREQISSGFKKLIQSFKNQNKASFEIDFSKSLNIYFTQKLVKLNSPFQTCEHLNSKIAFKSYPSQIPSLLNKSQQSFSNFSSFNRQRGLGVFMSKIKNVMAQKVKKVSNIGPTNCTHFSLETLPHLLCFLDENKVQCNYISYNDERFLSLVKQTDCFENLEFSKFDLDKNLSFSNTNSSCSDWSSSVNSSLTGFNSSKSWDCLTDNYFSTNETDNENELDKTEKNTESSRFKSKSLYLKNMVMNTRYRTIRSINDYPFSYNSSMISFSNLINLKKKISNSLEILEYDSKHLLDEEMENSESNNLNLSPIKLTLDDFKCSNNFQKELNPLKFSEKEKSEQFINRHPALVTRSKSADLINDKPFNKKTILKSKLNLCNINLNCDEIEETTKKNTILNGQVYQNNITHKNENVLTKDLSTSKSKIYQQNSQMICQSSEDLRNKFSKRSTRTFSKCCSRNKPRKSCSPPPPIFLSPTGLLPPPLQKYTIKESIENFEKKRRFNEIRNKFETETLTSIPSPNAVRYVKPLKHCSLKENSQSNIKNDFYESSFKANFVL